MASSAFQRRISKTLLINACAILLQLAATSILTYHLTPRNFGYWSYSYSLFAFLAIAFKLGGGALVLRESSRKNIYNVKSVFSHLAGLILSVALLSSIFVFLNLNNELDLPTPVVTILSIALILIASISSFNKVISNYYMGQNASVLSISLDFLPRGLGFFSAAMASLVTSNLLSIWLLFISGFMLVWIIYYKKIRESLRLIQRPIKVKYEYLKQGMLLALVYGYLQANLFIDSYFLIKFTNPEEVGFYRLAATLANISIVFSGSIQRQLSSTIGDFLEQAIPLGQLRREIKRTVLISSGLAITFVVGALLIGKPIISIFYGKTYLTAYTPLLVLLISNVMHFCLGPADIVLNISSNETTLFKATVSCILLNTIFNFFLIPTIGLLGCALSTLATTVFFKIILSYLAYTKTGINSTVFSIK